MVGFTKQDGPFLYNRIAIGTSYSSTGETDIMLLYGRGIQ